MTRAKDIETEAGLDVLLADILSALQNPGKPAQERINLVVDALRGRDRLLTREEQKIVLKLGDCANMFAKTLREIHGPTFREDQPSDYMEFGAAIHTAQNIVLARAAARAYPIDYRL